MLIGYMRVSSSDDRQVVDLQLDALLAAGVDERHLHQDKQSGGRDDRAGLKTCLSGLRAGDVLVVWKLDRLGRSLSHLVRILDDLKGRGVAFRSLTEGIDTTTSHGEFLYNLFGTPAQYERSLIRERVNAGLTATCLALAQQRGCVDADDRSAAGHTALVVRAVLGASGTWLASFLNGRCSGPG